MQANHDKCHLLLSGKHDVTMNASGFKIKKAECEKFSKLKSIVDLSLKTI